MDERHVKSRVQLDYQAASGRIRHEAYNLAMPIHGCASDEFMSRKHLPRERVREEYMPLACLTCKPPFTLESSSREPLVITIILQVNNAALYVLDHALCTYLLRDMFAPYQASPQPY